MKSTLNGSCLPAPANEARQLTSVVARYHTPMALILGLALGGATFYVPLASAQSTAPKPSNIESLPQLDVLGNTVSANEAYSGGQVTNGSRAGMLGEKDFMETPFNSISYTEKFIADNQAQAVTDVIAATDPSVFSSGVTGGEPRKLLHSRLPFRHRRRYVRRHVRCCPLLSELAGDV